MKFKRNEKYASIACYSFITVCACAIVVLCIINFRSFLGVLQKVADVLSPFTCGFIIAYLCNPIMAFYEKKLFSFKKSKKDMRRTSRVLSIILTILTVMLLIAVMLYAVLPQIITSYEDLGKQINVYIENIQKFADNFLNEHSEAVFGVKYSNLAEFMIAYDISFNFKDVLNYSYSLIESGFEYILDYGSKIVGGVKNALLGIILAIYFLLLKEKLCAQTKKILNAFLSRRHYLNCVRFARFTHKTFGGFITGKILDSIIIGILTFFVLWIFKIPYYPLIAVIVGITNIVPFFGPFIGAIPSAFIIFIASPAKALWFILLILIIQQIDGNIIGPKILGDSIGISALWVIIAITVCGGFFGFAGMLLGVPLTAVLYVMFKQYVERRLRHKNAPVTTEFYKSDPPVETDIDPEMVFIDSDTVVDAPTLADDIDIPQEKTKKRKSFSFDSIKKYTEKKKGNKK